MSNISDYIFMAITLLVKEINMCRKSSVNDMITTNTRDAACVKVVLDIMKLLMITRIIYSYIFTLISFDFLIS